MSVNAYRVTQQPVLADSASFGGYELIDLLCELENTFDGRDQHGGGTIEVYVDELKKLLESSLFIDMMDSADELETTRKAFLSDIAATDSDCITYEVF